MKIYGVPITGSVLFQAASSEEALKAANDWAAVVLENVVTGNAIPIPANLEIVILKPQSDTIVDATEAVAKLIAEAEEAE